MSQTTRSLMMKITADASQAESEVDGLQRKLRGADSFGFGRGGGGSVGGSIASDFDADSFNNRARQSVGVLGDMDSALQTFGSTLDVTSARIAGDFFAIGEAAVQLGGAAPAAASKLLSLSPALLGAGAAAGALTLAVTALVAESQRAAQENTNAFTARISAREKALEYEKLTDEQRAQRAKDLQAQINLIEEETNKARIDREKQWQEAVQSSVIFGDFFARVSQAVGKDTRVTEDSIIAQEERSKALREELNALNSVNPATSTFDSTVSKLTSSISGSKIAASEFANTLKATQEVFESVSSGIALTAKTIVNGRIVAKAQSEETVKDTFSNRQRIMDDTKRMNEDRLRQIQDYERRKFEIENNYRQSIWEAERSNDVRAFRNAGETRFQDMRRSNQNMVINFNNPNLGAIATPADLQQTQEQYTSLLVDVIGARKGMY